MVAQRREQLDHLPRQVIELAIQQCERAFRIALPGQGHDLTGHLMKAFVTFEKPRIGLPGLMPATLAVQPEAVITRLSVTMI